MDAFTRAYIEAALWSSTDDSNPGLDLQDYELADETRAAMAADCRKFQAENDCSERGDLQGGHDFWLTRNGHGCGFWDGDWPETGEALDKAAKAFGSCELYVGDDGRVYAV